ncbi:uncharacterized protein LOC103521692 [Diaphorina citri]|uniref:Uncharacterized protein LOC103521692 n=1 Tax=Diaphorina citri TaxID=121845 RepID=A0A1S3DMW7_DIACI|nr:uncharacterized protein LOC103521692 [Diaphorina citri]
MVLLVVQHLLQFQRQFCSISSSVQLSKAVVNSGKFLFKGQSSRSDRDVSSTSPESSSCRSYSFSIDPRKLESDGKSTKKPTDELLFDLYKNEDNVVPVGKFIAVTIYSILC